MSIFDLNSDWPDYPAPAPAQAVPADQVYAGRPAVPRLSSVAVPSGYTWDDNLGQLVEAPASASTDLQMQKFLEYLMSMRNNYGSGKNQSPASQFGTGIGKAIAGKKGGGGGGGIMSMLGGL